MDYERKINKIYEELMKEKELKEKIENKIEKLKHEMLKENDIVLFYQKKFAYKVLMEILGKDGEF